MKIIILVLSMNDNGIYNQFYNSQKETWDSIGVDNIETYYYFGNSIDNQIKGREILLNVKESLYNCGHKLIESFELIKNYDFDYVFRTNSSSYVDKIMLKNFLENKPKNNFYSGIIGRHKNIEFASGCGFSISKDLVTKIIENKSKWDHSLIDDVAIAQLLTKFSVTPIYAPRFDVLSRNNIPTNFFHYRLSTKNRDFDIQNMYHIYKLKNKI